MEQRRAFLDVFTVFDNFSFQIILFYFNAWSGICLSNIMTVAVSGAVLKQNKSPYFFYVCPLRRRLDQISAIFPPRHGLQAAEDEQFF